MQGAASTPASGDLASAATTIRFVGTDRGFGRFNPATGRNVADLHDLTAPMVAEHAAPVATLRAGMAGGRPGPGGGVRGRGAGHQ